MKHICPICQGKIVVERINDDQTIFNMDVDGCLTETYGRSDGETNVTCANDITHKLHPETIEVGMDSACDMS